MSSLSDLGVAGRSDLVPGVILSRPRAFVEAAEAERTFVQWVMSTMSSSCIGLPPALASVVLMDCKKDLLEGKYRYKSEAFNRWADNRNTMHYLLLLSAKVKHPTTTPEQVAKWLIDFDADNIGEAVYELWGYALRKSTRWRRPDPPTVDWDAILRRLTEPPKVDGTGGLGKTLAEVNELTESQLAALLGPGERDPEQIFRESFYDWLELICEAAGVEPAGLKAMDDETLGRWLTHTSPKERKHPIEMSIARRYVAQYVLACA